MSAMTEKTRQELRNEIERVYHMSLMRRYWGFVGRGLARLVGGKGEAPVWVSSLVTLLIVQGITQIVLAVQKEPTGTSSASIQNTYPMLFYIWLGIVVFQGLIDHFISTVKTTVVDSLDLPAGEASLNKWLGMTGRLPTQWTVVVLFTLLFARITIFVIMNQPGMSPGLAEYLFNLLLFSQITPHLYWILIIALTFTTWIRDWKFTLFQDDPARSSVIQKLHHESSAILLIVALLMALNFILVIPFRLYSQTYLIVSIAIFWLPALLYFWLSETSYANLVRDAKLARLSVIQKQIMEIESSQDMTQKEPAEAVQRLLDLHDRIKTAPVSLINLNSVANLLGSLALPLLAFLINIFDIWQRLFSAP